MLIKIQKSTTLNKNENKTWAFFYLLLLFLFCLFFVFFVSLFFVLPMLWYFRDVLPIFLVVGAGINKIIPPFKSLIQQKELLWTSNLFFNHAWMQNNNHRFAKRSIYIDSTLLFVNIFELVFDIDYESILNYKQTTYLLNCSIHMHSKWLAFQQCIIFSLCF